MPVQNLGILEMRLWDSRVGVRANYGNPTDDTIPGKD